MKNLHRLMGSRYEHEKVGLCDRCVFRRDYGEWQGYCTAHNKILSAASSNVKKPRCKDFQKANQE